MRRMLQLFMTVSLLVFSALPANANCHNYHCIYAGEDLAHCTIFIGPLGRIGSECIEQELCMWNYNPQLGGWTMSCKYDCAINGCYLV